MFLNICVFLLHLLPLASGFSSPKAATGCACPAISNIWKTGETSSSIAFSWLGTSGATQYRTWYVRHADNSVGGNSYTSGTSRSFADLSPGSYTFYFEAICGEETSGFIGIEDIVEF